MRIISLLIILFFVCGCDCNYKEENLSEKSVLKEAKITFAKFKKTLKSDGGRFWNHELNSPILLIDRVTRIFIANENDLQGNFQKQKNLYCGRFRESMNIGNGIQEWNGKIWVVTELPLPDESEDRMRLLIHESFHRIQPEIGFDSLDEVQNFHLDTKEGRILLKLELEALKKALNSDKPEEHIKNALLFRGFRHQLFPGSSNAENSLEINEGIAEYTGTILCGLDNSGLIKRYVSQIDRIYAMPTFVRSFPYCTLPVYGYFMRQKRYDWNLEIRRKTNLTDFISAFFGVNYSTLANDDISRIGKIYYLDSITRIEEKRESIRSAQIIEYKNQFFRDSVLTIDLKNIEVATNMKNFLTIDTIGTVYQNIRITSDWGILEVDSCGAFISSNWKQAIISKPFSITDTLIRGNGWKLKLYDKWKLIGEGRKYKVAR